MNSTFESPRAALAQDLTIIGCRAGSPGTNGAASGYVVRVDGKTLLIDCGPGVVLGLAQRGLIERLDAVINTHAHADHCADLVGLAYHRLFPNRMPQLPIYAPEPLLRVLDLLDAAFGIPSLPNLRKPLNIAFAPHVVKPGDAFEIAGTRIETLVTRHPIPTMAIKIPAAGFVFTADGAMSPQLVEFARGARCLLAEATYPDAVGRDLVSHGHITAGQAGALARDAGVGSLILTHLSSVDDEDASLRAAQSEFAGDIHLARPGLCVPLAS
jgi:ribonuclease BN (tRNA processing enzyme)